MHCACEACRITLRERFAKQGYYPCDCSQCTGPVGPHVALYNRYRPMTLKGQSSG